MHTWQQKYTNKNIRQIEKTEGGGGGGGGAGRIELNETTFYFFSHFL